MHRLRQEGTNVTSKKVHNFICCFNIWAKGYRLCRTLFPNVVIQPLCASGLYHSPLAKQTDFATSRVQWKDSQSHLHQERSLQWQLRRDVSAEHIFNINSKLKKSRGKISAACKTAQTGQRMLWSNINLSYLHSLGSKIFHKEGFELGNGAPGL